MANVLDAAAYILEKQGKMITLTYHPHYQLSKS